MVEKYKAQPNELRGDTHFVLPGDIELVLTADYAALEAERDEWKRRCEAMVAMLGDEHALLSGHEGTDDWYCATSRTWFPITDLSVEEGEPPQCPFSCACRNVFIAPELEITIDTLARARAIAEGRDNE